MFSFCNKTNAFKPYAGTETRIASLAKTILSGRAITRPTFTFQGQAENKVLSLSVPDDVVELFRSYCLSVIFHAFFIQGSEHILKSCLDAFFAFKDQNQDSGHLLFGEADIQNLLYIVSCITDQVSIPSEQLEFLTKFSEQAQEFEVRANAGLSFNKFYLTSRGYVGTGPPSLEPGDQVWLICDARVPFVVRPSNVDKLEYRLVGETYLHGCMHGEMMTPELKSRIGPIFLV
jgi:hypothetical protein